MSQNQYRYQLERTSKKYECPQCHQRTFVRYVDNSTSKHLSVNVGRCDREQKCSHHFTPKQYFVDNPLFEPSTEWKAAPPPPPKDLSFIDNKYLTRSMQHYKINPFVQWLHSLFDNEIVQRLIQQFKVGTSKKWNGSNVFWQVDNDLKVRQAKVMRYDPATGKRNKQLGAFFSGKALMKMQGVPEPNLSQCLYGLHQINTDDGQTIAIVESEKTAILMTAFGWLGIAPKYTWLATGGKNGCKWKEPTTWQAIQERKIQLFPDLGAFEDWNKKRIYINDKTFISDLLMRSATDEQRKEGLDVADFFLDYYLDLKKQKKTGISASAKIEINEHGYPAFWDA